MRRRGMRCTGRGRSDLRRIWWSLWRSRGARQADDWVDRCCWGGNGRVAWGGGGLYSGTVSFEMKQAKTRTPTERAIHPRRSVRFSLKLPVVVYGRTPDNKPFRDRTRTLSVDAHGARLSVAAPLQSGQSLLLVNSFTQEERKCRVVHVSARNGKRSKRSMVGVEFTNEPRDFWHVYNAEVEMRGNGTRAH